MATIAIHILDCDIVPAGDSHAIILIVDRAVGQYHVARGRNIKSIRIVCRCKSTADSIWGISCWIIEFNVGNHQIAAAGDTEAMDRVVPDMKILDYWAGRHLVQNNEVIRPVKSVCETRMMEEGRMSEIE